jgi:Tol biopolymer transport system component
VEETRGVLAPLAWTPAGLVVERIFWATDAPPQELIVVDPTDGSVQSLRNASHLQAVPSPDGSKVALVKGEVPIGGTPAFEIAILDIASGNETTIVLSRQGLVKALRWSPDGARLLYAMSETYDTLVTSVVALDADGSNQQQVDFGATGFELAVHDLAWRDAETPLVLVTNQMGQIELNALPLDSFDATGLQSLGTFEGDAGDQAPQILYVPRGV